MTDDLIYRLHQRAFIRRGSGPDPTSDLLEEAAREIARLSREQEWPNIWLEGGEVAHRARGQD